MNLKKIITFSVPFFAFAIISRAVEEISFFYYTVPVLCVVFILTELWIGKSKKLDVRSKERTPDSRQAGMTSNLYSRMTDTLRTEMISNVDPSFRRTSFAGMTIINKSFLLFFLLGIWFLVTSLWSVYPDISALRSLYFILISTGSIASAILWTNFSGKGILDFLLPTNIIVVLMGIFSLVTNIPADSWVVGNGKGFAGFFGHQNLLASIILFTMPVVLYRVVILAKSRIGIVESSDSRPTSFAGMTVKSDSSFRQSPESEIPSNYLPLTAYSLLLTANLFLLIITYSRASIVSLAFGIIIFLLINKKWKIIAYSFGAAALVAIIIFISPALKNLSDNIINKDFPEFYSSRIWMWEPSYKATLDGGLVGLGYGISDPNIKPGNVGDHYEGERFVREKGNSTLALIEETGLIGLILFLIPVISIVILSVTKDLKWLRFLIPDNSGFRMTNNYSQLNTQYSLLTAALTAFLLHAQFEAWWVGVGSVQLPLFFIYIGLSIALTNFEQNNFELINLNK